MSKKQQAQEFFQKKKEVAKEKCGCKHSKGKLPLKIEVIEPDNQIKLRFRSVSRKVNVDGEMIAKLERIGVKYKLNA